VSSNAALEMHNMDNEAARDGAPTRIDTGSGTFIHSRLASKRNSLMFSALSLDTAPEEKHLKPTDAALQAKNDLKEPDVPPSMPAMHFFNIISQGIALKSLNDGATCTPEPIDDQQRDEQFKQLQDVRQGQELKLSEKLESDLYFCVTDEMCGAVSIELEKTANGTWESKVCQHNYQILPVLGKYNKHITLFWKNPIAILDDLEATETDLSKFYEEALKKLTWQEGMFKIQQVAERGCVCERANLQMSKGTSCRTYQTTSQLDRHWCYVREDHQVYRACEDANMKLFWDDKKSKVWTEDICMPKQEKGCRCSGIGMYPLSDKDNDHNSSLLEGNSLNYGRTCKKWRNNDEMEWCYAGYDSTCPDRNKQAEQWVGKNRKTQWMQYESALPCDNRQTEIRDSAKAWCWQISMPTQTLLSITVFLYIPMVVIMFKFLNNRCGDECNLDDQFAVILTSDEESEDEWAAGGGSKREEEGNATQPVTQ